MDIVYYVATRLDGYIADADGGVDWLNQYINTGEDYGLKSVWLMGGGKIAGSFRQVGLISRYMIAVIPIILGDGIPLFDGAQRRDPLKLTDSKVFPTGIVMLTYDS